jgi:uncharacterized protein YjbI with pentapeptide repeats
MTVEVGVVAKKGSLKKSIKIDVKELSKALMKGSVHAVQGEWKSVLEDGADAIASLGLTDAASAAAWNLVYRSLFKAIEEITKETLGLTNDDTQKKSLSGKIDLVLQKSNLVINKKFFEFPEENLVMQHAVPEFEKWLCDQGISASASQAISARLPAYFTLALHEEWGALPGTYSVLKECLDTPFTQASERIRREELYKSWLVKQIDEPMLGEPFGLKKLFVSPRAYFIKRIRREESGISGDSNNEYNEKVVVNLQDYLWDWIDDAKQDDAIRLISGGPGSGKSSFAKMLAALMARRNDVDVLFIPLHHFEPSADMIDAVGKFVKTDGFLEENPLISSHRKNRLFLIFDGLDELAMQGKIAARTAREFVREVLRKIERLNQVKTRVQILITGRELVVQESEADFRKEEQILHLLPYHIGKNEIRKYIDPKKLLVIDQRDIWWQKYGAATGQYYQNLPAELAQPHFEEITAQPLLNYLVALSLQRGELKFDKGTNLNSIYADLLKAIYERGWSKHQHAAIQGVEEKDFSRVLEEIALATWHGDGRTTTIKDIKSHCDSSGIIKLLDRFQYQLQEDSQTKVTQLLTAFYFRRSGHDTSGEETFEFTHKSFGEYLTVRRILREIELINRKLDAKDSDPDEGWDEREALHRWLAICGPTEIDSYLWKFLIDEIHLKYVQSSFAIEQFQNKFCRLFGFMLRDGMPLERMSPRFRFFEERRYARNAESALLICLGIFSRLTKKISRIEWEDAFSFGNWISRTWGQSKGFAVLPLFGSLCYLDLSGCWLNSRHFWNANFEGSDLSKANLVSSDCRYSDFTNVNLTGAFIAHANLHGAKFNNAVLMNANFSPISLPRLDEPYGDEDEPDGAVFKGMNLDGAKFDDADLRGADFEGASLKKAQFKSALLVGANFRSANLEEANFKGSNLELTDFVGANLENANFEKSRKKGTKFDVGS